MLNQDLSSEREDEILPNAFPSLFAILSTSIALIQFVPVDSSDSGLTSRYTFALSSCSKFQI